MHSASALLIAYIAAAGFLALGFGLALDSRRP